MTNVTLLLCSLLYLGLLFAVAYWAERRGRANRSVANNPYIYALSLAVYCTAWTFYGSVGRAASEGLEFLAIYIGPALTAPLWWVILRKMIRICNGQRITSIADFISARYGKNRTLGVLVTAVCVVGMIPYISIQLKAIADSFGILTNQTEAVGAGPFYEDKAFIVSVVLALFTILFGTRKLEATEQHEGLVTAVAFESIVKLVAFLAVGIFVTFGLFDGPADIFRQASAQPVLRQEFTTGPGHTSADWFWYCLLSATAILFLPRQFQVAVVENSDEKHVSKALWLFPFYLLLINLFVIPMAFGGKLLLPNTFNADGYVLTLPLQYGQKGLALLAYLGGFSAATSMIIVETIALSVMISNNVVMPLLVSSPRWQTWFGAASSLFVINVRRLAILALLLMAYLYAQGVSSHYSLVSVGTISFVAVAQFTPAMLGGLFWKRGAKQGALLGLLGGMVVWFYTLIIPTLVPLGWIPASWLTIGPAGLGWLNPQTLLGLTKLDPIAHAVFWTLLVNTLGYVWGSLSRPQRTLDQKQAVLFVDVFEYSRQAQERQSVWKGQAKLSDLRTLLTSFFGAEQARRVLSRYARRNKINEQQTPADPRFVAYTERLLSGAIGTASARIAVASVSKEDPIAADEVIQILKESQALVAVNKELQQLTRQLSDANERLQVADRQKDDFVSTVTHEIRTPITSIRALVEIVHDTPDLDRDTQTYFLGTVIKESERLTRLINQVLDLERMESGRYSFNQVRLSMDELIGEAINAVRPLTADKPLRIETYLTGNCLVYADRDRLMQVLINLLANAIKFAPASGGYVRVRSVCEAGTCRVSVADNGAGIDPHYHALIFEKFRQVDEAGRNHAATMGQKPTGSGLGLAISKRIVELHSGQISLSSQPGEGATFEIQLPGLPPDSPTQPAIDAPAP